MHMQIQELQNFAGKFTIAAIDQRASLGKILLVDLKTSVGKEHIALVKTALMEEFSPMCSAVLVDPDYGLPALAKKLHNTGLLLTLEGFDYADVQAENMPLIKKQWGVEQIAQRGASVKFYFQFHPYEKNAKKKITLVQEIYEKARKNNVPFLLEPILYKRSEENEKQFTQSYMELFESMVQTFTTSCDVLKLEFPFAPGEKRDELVAEDRCKKISALSTVPWVLLSRGIDFDDYKQALTIAMHNGASGFAVGRAVWKEIGQYKTWEEQLEFIRTTARERMESLIRLVESS